MRTNGTLYYLLGDHLGSTSLTTNATGTVVSELRYKAWGEVRSALGDMPTQYQFNGQYSYESSFGLYFYNARWVDVSLGRFTQADTVVTGGVQGLDRYAYVNNRPCNNTDPTGHRPVGDEDMQRKPSCARQPSKDAKKDLDTLPISTSSHMDTYTSANIALQKGPAPYQWLSQLLKGKYASEGPAKITDAEMETTYGEAINEGKNNYGLGLRTPGAKTPDQNDMTVAFTAMSTRIQVRPDMCQRTRFACTPTDIFLVAAVGGDNGMGPGDLRDLGNGAQNYGRPDLTTGIFAWDAYLDKHENQSHVLSVIQQFVDNVAYLQEQGAAVPDVNWTYICDDLLK
jgi:RHS repeat-associated protein